MPAEHEKRTGIMDDYYWYNCWIWLRLVYSGMFLLWQWGLQVPPFGGLQDAHLFQVAPHLNTEIQCSFSVGLRIAQQVPSSFLLQQYQLYSTQSHNTTTSLYNRGIRRRVRNDKIPCIYLYCTFNSIYIAMCPHKTCNTCCKLHNYKLLPLQSIAVDCTVSWSNFQYTLCVSLLQVVPLSLSSWFPHWEMPVSCQLSKYYNRWQLYPRLELPSCTWKFLTSLNITLICTPQVLLRKLQLLHWSKNSWFYWNFKFITTFTEVCHWSLFWAEWVYSIPSCPISLRHISLPP